MNVNRAIHIIRRHRQAFAYGVEGVHTLFNTGIEGGNPMKPLRTNIANDLIHSTFHLTRAKLNSQLEQATTNRLGMQLVVGAGDAMKQLVDDWKNDPRPEIQFLRQIRNGAAHDNRLEFKSVKDPRPNTRWRGSDITEDMEGNIVFTDIRDRIWGSEMVEMEEGILEAGDALALTTDLLKLLIPKSEKYGPGNVIGLSEADFSNGENSSW